MPCERFFGELYRVGASYPIEYDDILGPLFEKCGFSRTGQDQTPPDLARLAASLSLGNNPSIPLKGYLNLDECACGSGAKASFTLTQFEQSMRKADVLCCIAKAVYCRPTAKRWRMR